MSGNSIPIISSLEDGPPYEAFVIANPVEIDDISTDGHVIARCYHKHKGEQTARSCAEQLWQQRCPTLYRCWLAAKFLMEEDDED